MSSGPRNALIDLPAGGCQLPVPEMPKGRDWTDAERERWAELWESPQATQWDDSARGVVGVLVAYETAIFSGKAASWQALEARHASESLGLSPRALVALGWRIVGDE
ncbi:hypothetical protein [Yimella lutea]|uniref:hypothetical protein n=1 Tax=Yimella lutea TaxID=587872 RepID=UPI001B874E05|nr:hypothetical protein [Yimella lutea]